MPVLLFIVFVILVLIFFVVFVVAALIYRIKILGVLVKLYGKNYNGYQQYQCKSHKYYEKDRLDVVRNIIIKEPFRVGFIRLLLQFALRSRACLRRYKSLICSLVLIIPVPALIPFRAHGIYQEKISRIHTVYGSSTSSSNAFLHKSRQCLSVPVEYSFCIAGRNLAFAVSKNDNKAIFYSLKHSEFVKSPR